MNNPFLIPPEFNSSKFFFALNFTSLMENAFVALVLA